jgi:cytochrome c biogenesis protein CcmG/thiol:disulfide interchange protein DsbE
MTGRLRLAAAVGLLALLSACTQAPAVTRSSEAAQTTGAAPDRAPDSSGLGAAKKAAGIPDCPASDRDVTPVPDGLPDAVLPCLGGGRPVRLAGLRGKPMLLNVWAQWCGPCREEAPFLADVASTNRSELVVLGIDHADPLPGRAIEFAQVAAWTYPQIQDRDSVLRTDLQVAALPQTFFVRADGSIAYRNLRPFTSAEQIRTLSQRYLGVTP